MTVSIQGTQGKWIQETRILNMGFGNNHYIKLYYGADNLQIKEYTTGSGNGINKRGYYMKKKWGLALLASACCLLMSPTGILAAQPTELFTAEETVTSDTEQNSETTEFTNDVNDAETISR